MSCQTSEVRHDLENNQNSHAPSGHQKYHRTRTDHRYRSINIDARTADKSEELQTIRIDAAGQGSTVHKRRMAIVKGVGMKQKAKDEWFVGITIGLLIDIAIVIVLL